MSKEISQSDVLIIGAGFFGCALALRLIETKQAKSVIIVEKEDGILLRASKINQARVHNGYHYPRSFTTAYRSRKNFPKFCKDFPEAIENNFNKIYAVARLNSKVSAKQFERFCKEIGADLEPVSKSYQDLFETRLIERAYHVKECAFNTVILAELLSASLAKQNIATVLKTKVINIFSNSSGERKLKVELQTEENTVSNILTDKVFNCAYSGINDIGGDFTPTVAKFKHEIAELALVELPENFKDIGITVVDGPFFSVMPYPAEKLHTLSHVRYTPHHSYFDEVGKSAYEGMIKFEKETRVDRMIRDSKRYLPFIENCTYKKSIFELKTVLIKNEKDDGRPILFEQNQGLPNVYSILGSKIDNVYDVFKATEGV